MLTPQLDVLPPAQRELWPELAAVPERYVLYGGTALALRLGHRGSVDFDFFAHDPLDHRELETKVSIVQHGQTVQEAPNERTVLVDRAEASVKVSFFGGVTIGRVGDPEGTEDGVRVASLLDLAGTKVKALLQRVEAKDYLDVVALLDGGMALVDILGAARALFGTSFNPLVAQKALTYFEGGDLHTLSEQARRRLIAEATQDLQVAPLPLRSTRLD
jgi:predicted nucleotidyltransferase component of viral defense system